MLDTIHAALVPWYLELKFVHLFFVMIWAWSTSVAYSYYVKGAFLAWERNPDDPVAIQRRNFAIDQFDKGAILEHVAFPVILVTGPLLYWLGPWNLDFTWLVIKLAVVVLVFVPMEICDYWLAHFGGNKARLRRRGLMQQHERAIRLHWQFLKVSTPLIVIFMPLAVYLAVVKPGGLWP